MRGDSEGPWIELTSLLGVIKCGLDLRAQEVSVRCQQNLGQRELGVSFVAATTAVSSAAWQATSIPPTSRAI